MKSTDAELKPILTKMCENTHHKYSLILGKCFPGKVFPFADRHLGVRFGAIILFVFSIKSQKGLFQPML